MGVMADYQLPEMLRTPLEELVLQIKILKMGAAATFLAKAIEPPSDTAILNALSCLQQLVECTLYLYNYAFCVCTQVHVYRHVHSSCRAAWALQLICWKYRDLCTEVM